MTDEDDRYHAAVEAGHCTCPERPCPVHVSCDEHCQAPLTPDDPEGLMAAYTHWRFHRLTGGCSHGN